MLHDASIIIPTYNEARNLPNLVNRLLEIAGDIAERVEIVIVDDNSPDGTGMIAEALAGEHANIKVIHRPSKGGVGNAVFDGARVATSSFLVVMDADLHHRPEFVPSITRHLPEYDIVVASRFMSGEKTSRMEAKSVQRRLITRFGNSLSELLLQLHMNDYTHGFRGYSRSAFLKCYCARDIGGEFNLRILIEARRRGFKALEVPYCSEHEGKPKVRDWLKYARVLLGEI